MQSTTDHNHDLFDRIAGKAFGELTSSDQAEFLKEFALEDYDYIQQAVAESADYFKAEFAALEVHPAVYDDLNERINGKPAAKFNLAVFLGEALSYRVPVYQVCSVLVLIFAGFWLFQQSNQMPNETMGAQSYVADSTFKATSVLADSGSNRAGFDGSVVPVQQELEQDAHTVDTAMFTPGVAPETSDLQEFIPTDLILNDDEMAQHNRVSSQSYGLDHFASYACKVAIPRLAFG
jgi:hypothetical protein